jgi:hypothetical protein
MGGDIEAPPVYTLPLPFDGRGVGEEIRGLGGDLLQESLQYVQEGSRLRVGHWDRQTPTTATGEEDTAVEGVQEEFVGQRFIAALRAAVIDDRVGAPVDAK